MNGFDNFLWSRDGPTNGPNWTRLDGEWDWTGAESIPRRHPIVRLKDTTYLLTQ